MRLWLRVDDARRSSSRKAERREQKSEDGEHRAEIACSFVKSVCRTVSAWSTRSCNGACGRGSTFSFSFGYAIVEDKKRIVIILLKFIAHLLAGGSALEQTLMIRCQI